MGHADASRPIIALVVVPRHCRLWSLRPLIALVVVPPVEVSWGKEVVDTVHQALPVKTVRSASKAVGV